MKKRFRRGGVFIIGDTPTFGRVVRALLEPHQLSDLGTFVIRSSTYEALSLSPMILRETALFVVELWRNYSTGMRAEGLAVAKQLIQLGSVPLVVSSLSIGGTAAGTHYWDFSSKETLGERCARLLREQQGNMRRVDKGLVQLERTLADYMNKQVGHAEREPTD